MTTRKEFYNKAFYDDGPQYKEWCWRAEVIWRPRAQILVDLFHPRTVLDLGCAKGPLVKYLVSMDVDAMGLDLSEYAIKETPHKEIATRLLLCDAINGIPFGDDVFDLVVGFDFLEHIPSGYLAFVCNEVSRVAKQHLLFRMPMVSGATLEHIDTYTHLSIRERMDLIGKPPFENIRTNASSIEHPSMHPRAFWEETFSQLGWEEILLEEKYYDDHMPDTEDVVLYWWDTIVFRRESIGSQSTLET